MKKRNKFRYIAVIMAFLLIVITIEPTKSSAANQPMVYLGSIATYAVLAGSTITNTGTTIINGDAGSDIGLSPGNAFTAQASVSMNGGSVHLADVNAVQAKNDLVTAYNDAASRLPVITIPSQLGGTTLTPGTYDSADGKFQITGTLTLDSQGDPAGVFIFKTASTLVTAENSNIILINSAGYFQTFWQVGSSATLGTNSHFVGHLFAMASITANTGATIQGQLLARDGAVTLDNNIITNGISAFAVIPTSIPTPTPTTIATVTPTPIPTIIPTGTPTPITTIIPTGTPTPTSTITPTVSPRAPTPSITLVPTMI
ncbi:MAG: ice-binding family protein, partial [Mobilitalea sp.]